MRMTFGDLARLMVCLTGAYVLSSLPQRLLSHLQVFKTSGIKAGSTSTNTLMKSS